MAHLQWPNFKQDFEYAHNVNTLFLGVLHCPTASFLFYGSCNTDVSKFMSTPGRSQLNLKQFYPYIAWQSLITICGGRKPLLTEVKLTDNKDRKTPMAKRTFFSCFQCLVLSSSIPKSNEILSFVKACLETT